MPVWKGLRRQGRARPGASTSRGRWRAIRWSLPGQLLSLSHGSTKAHSLWEPPDKNGHSGFELQIVQPSLRTDTVVPLLDKLMPEFGNGRFKYMWLYCSFFSWNWVVDQASVSKWADGSSCTVLISLPAGFRGCDWCRQAGSLFHSWGGGAAPGPCTQSLLRLMKQAGASQEPAISVRAPPGPPCTLTRPGPSALLTFPRSYWQCWAEVRPQLQLKSISCSCSHKRLARSVQRTGQLVRQLTSITPGTGFFHSFFISASPLISCSWKRKLCSRCVCERDVRSQVIIQFITFLLTGAVIDSSSKWQGLNFIAPPWSQHFLACLISQYVCFVWFCITVSS